jgi:hypothetical protein
MKSWKVAVSRPRLEGWAMGQDIVNHRERRHTDFRLVNWRISIVLVKRLLRGLTRR